MRLFFSLSKPLLLAILFWVAFESPAQVIMVPTTRTINTPYGPAQLTSYQQMPMHYSFNQGRYITVPHVGKTQMTIALKSDSIFTEKLYFNVADSIHSLTLERREKKGGDLVYKPGDTRQVSQMFNGKLVVGIPADTCWLFKMEEGLIKSYAPFPTAVKDFYSAVQKGDGPIVPMTKENVKEMVADQPKLLKLEEKGELIQAIWKYNGSN